MADHEVERSTTTDGLPVSVSLGPTLEAEHVPARPSLVDGRVVVLCLLSVALALAAAVVAKGLGALIALITNLAFHWRWSAAPAEPSTDRLGIFVIIVPVLGGLVVGLMARYGSKAIRGHGIPEAMEQVLLNQSRIPARMTFLKPVSAAIAIGTGGPFGAEGPIIATGGALGSLIGQLLRTTATERKTLLAAGAAAGMAATFGSPVSAVLLAVELLLFEFRPRSIIPVSLAAAAAAGARLAMKADYPVFPMPVLNAPSGEALTAYIIIGALMGLVAMIVTRAVYAIEDAFEHFPLHWMWWPAIGALAVGVIGYFQPRTMGVGYGNIAAYLKTGQIAAWTALAFVALKFLSWSIALGSGTSGGTLAPLLTIGGGVGSAMGLAAARIWPAAHVDPRIGALVGMAAMFAGASRAMLASVVFAFETTLQPLGLLPLLGGCAASMLVSALTMRHSIMTEKIARRGVQVPAEYAPDFLDHVLVRDVSSKTVVSLRPSQRLDEVRAWVASRVNGATHQGFPVIDDAGVLVGVLTRRNLLDPEVPADRTMADLIKRRASFIYEDSTLRQAADQMVRHDIGRLPVVDRQTRKVVGIVTRSDLLKAHRRRLREEGNE
jgi:H+/Cl- antiporter ClcA/predicted transcriptional regulator